VIQIARVDYPNTPPDLKRLLVRRARGVAGVHGQVVIDQTDPDEFGATALRAHVDREDGSAQTPQVVLLDAALAEHVLAAVTRLVEDPAALGAQAGSPWAWTVELDWAGRVTHLEVHGTPTDAALHGVLEAAARLLDDQSPSTVS
jgi:hypothetical protein